MVAAPCHLNEFGLELLAFGDQFLYLLDTQQVEELQNGYLAILNLAEEREGKDSYQGDHTD